MLAARNRFITRITAIVFTTLLLTSCSSQPHSPVNSEHSNGNSGSAPLQSPHNSDGEPHHFMHPENFSSLTRDPHTQPDVKTIQLQDFDEKLKRNTNSDLFLHESAGWEWLAHPGMIVPGGKISNLMHPANCSVGFIAAREERRFIVTAGHCGVQGDLIEITNAQGDTSHIGEIVESIFDGNDADKQKIYQDWSLIEIYPEAQKYIVPSPFNVKFQRPAPPSTLTTSTTMCRLGAKTGLACGNFLQDKGNVFTYRDGATQHGDSGGPVFTYVNEQLHPTGLVSGTSPEAPTESISATVSPILNKWGLTLI